MTRFQIPRIFLAGFEALSKLTSKQAKEIANLLNGVSVGANEQTVSTLLQKKLKLKEWDSFNISSVVFSLVDLKLSRNDQSDAFVQEMAQAYMKQTEANSDAGENLASNLKVILSSDGNLRLTQKANYLQSEYEKVFSDCRIISDVRLVYENEVDKAATHALVVHQLRITYSESGTQKSVYIALDNNDISALKESIIRAEEKDKQIRTHKYTQNITFFDFENS